MKAPGEEPSIMRHPLVSTLLWAWQKFNGVTPGEGKGGEGNKKSSSPRSSPKSGGELGLMWQEEYGGHLDLYAEYFTELNTSQPAGQQNKENRESSGTITPNYSPFATPSPGNWGWYIPITPPREGMFGTTNSPGPGTGRISKPLKVVVASPVTAPTSSLSPIQPAPTSS